MLFCSRLRVLASLLWLIAIHGSYAGQPVQGTGVIEVAFSPSGGAEDLVVKTLDSARHEIRLMAYSFTNPRIVRALLNAHRRRVDVALVVDYKSNIDEGRSNKSRAALSVLHEAGIDVRTLDAFAIAHDKVIIVDAETVQTGSFNYSAAAENRNSENVLVAWRNPPLATLYLSHFGRNQRLAKRFTSSY